MDNIYNNYTFQRLMLISFLTGNHRSIKSKVELNLEARADDHLEATRVIAASSKANRILRSALIYGPNASGKSNLIKGLFLMKKLVLSNMPAEALSAPTNRRIPVEPYLLDTISHKEPSYLGVTFQHGDFTYTYEFEATLLEIKSECLRRKGPGKEANLFKRVGTQVECGNLFPEGQSRLPFLRPNGLFLSLCAELNGEESNKITQWFQRLTFLGKNTNEQELSETYDTMRQSESCARLSELAQHSDFGIDELKLREFDPSRIKMQFPDSFTPEQKERELKRMALYNTEVLMVHKRYDPKGVLANKIELSLKQHGSDGTRRFLNLAAPLLRGIQKNAIFLVDEIEVSLHPLLMKTLFEWYHQVAQGSESQMIACTHDVFLMDPELIRRDQVWFTEKDEKGSTNLTCLAEFDPAIVRPTTKFNRQYLLGVFGAIPHPNFLQKEL